MAQDLISHHTERALAEIDRARAAPCPIAAKAHLELSELHLEEVRLLTEDSEAGMSSQAE